MVYLVVIAACLFFYPKQSLQWLLAADARRLRGLDSGTILSLRSLAWFVISLSLKPCAPIMWLFELLNKRAKVSTSSANNNGRAKA